MKPNQSFPLISTHSPPLSPLAAPISTSRSFFQLLSYHSHFSTFLLKLKWETNFSLCIRLMIVYQSYCPLDRIWDLGFSWVRLELGFKWLKILEKSIFIIYVSGVCVVYKENVTELLSNFDYMSYVFWFLSEQENCQLYDG